jgi:hypothetical protein
MFYAIINGGLLEPEPKYLKPLRITAHHSHDKRKSSPKKRSSSPPEEFRSNIAGFINRPEQSLTKSLSTLSLKEKASLPSKALTSQDAEINMPNRDSFNKPASSSKLSQLVSKLNPFRSTKACDSKIKNPMSPPSLPYESTAPVTPPQQSPHRGLIRPRDQKTADHDRQRLADFLHLAKKEINSQLARERQYQNRLRVLHERQGALQLEQQRLLNPTQPTISESERVVLNNTRTIRKRLRELEQELENIAKRIHHAQWKEEERIERFYEESSVRPLSSVEEEFIREQMMETTAQEVAIWRNQEARLALEAVEEVLGTSIAATWDDAVFPPFVGASGENKKASAVPTAVPELAYVELALPKVPVPQGQVCPEQADIIEAQMLRQRLTLAELQARAHSRGSGNQLIAYARCVERTRRRSLSLKQSASAASLRQ